MTLPPDAEALIPRLIATGRIDEPTARAGVRIELFIRAATDESRRTDADMATIAELVAQFPALAERPGSQLWFWRSLDALAYGWAGVTGLGPDGMAAYVTACAEVTQPAELATMISATRAWRARRDGLS